MPYIVVQKEVINKGLGLQLFLKTVFCLLEQKNLKTFSSIFYYQKIENKKFSNCFLFVSFFFFVFYYQKSENRKFSENFF